MSTVLYRSNKNKTLFGVCGGIAEYFGFNATALRILFLIFTPITTGLYIALIILMPLRHYLK